MGRRRHRRGHHRSVGGVARRGPAGVASGRRARTLVGRRRGFDAVGGERALAHRAAARRQALASAAARGDRGSCVAARAATWAGASFQQNASDRSLVHVVPAGHDAATSPPRHSPSCRWTRSSAPRCTRSACAPSACSPRSSAEDVERRWGERRAARVAAGARRRSAPPRAGARGDAARGGGGARVAVGDDGARAVPRARRARPAGAGDDRAWARRGRRRHHAHARRRARRAGRRRRTP